MESKNKKYFSGNESAITWLNELFARYFDGEATDKEKKAIEGWRPEESTSPYLATNEEVNEGCEVVWTRLSNQFGFKHELPKERKVIKLYRYTKYVAAAIITILLSAGFYFYTTRQTNTIDKEQALAKNYYYTGAGEKKKMLLPDGSVVYLNSDTRLGIASLAFNEEKREIWLEEGEAFFEVAKNPEKPFIIHTHTLQTTVKGTSFNVKAYKEIDESSVSVREGKVEVRHNTKLLGILTQNRQIIFNKNSKESYESEAVWQDAASWIEGRLVMKRTNTKELKLRLRQYYGVEVEFKNNVLEGTLLNSSFEKGADLNHVLEVISLLYDVKYDNSNPKKVIFYK
mgnify:CR=1 FL=1